MFETSATWNGHTESTTNIIQSIVFLLKYCCLYSLFGLLILFIAGHRCLNNNLIQPAAKLPDYKSLTVRSAYNHTEETV